MKKMLHTPDPRLREKAQEVTKTDIESEHIRAIIDALKATLAHEKYGVAIAAPQIGEPLRIFVVSGEVLARRAGTQYDPHKDTDRVYINPVIASTSKKRVVGDEGCLSVPGKYGTKVERPDKVRLRYLDERGVECERGASGFLARIFQHEVDHLNGILYTDIAEEVVDVDENLHLLRH